MIADWDKTEVGNRRHSRVREQMSAGEVLTVVIAGHGTLDVTHGRWSGFKACPQLNKECG